MFRRFLLTVTFSLAFILSAGFFLFFYYGRGLPDYQFLKNYRPPLATRFYANNYEVFKEWGVQKRFLKPLDQIPEKLIQAVLSAEDKNFYSHYGIDLAGLLRSLMINCVKKEKKSRPLGASTLTQQIAKNFLVGNELSLRRKIKEAILAIRLERTLSKQRILELYLNQVYFGRRCYGVAAAAYGYFGKDVESLTWAECAFLAALLKAPTSYNLDHDLQRIKERRNWVLHRLYEDGKLSHSELIILQKEPICLKEPQSFGGEADYFADDVQRYLKHHFKTLNLATDGLKVFTTLDPDLQRLAHAALQRGLKAYNPSLAIPEVSGGIIVMDAPTGRVLALSGGFDYRISQFNCATQAWRQSGSVFKTFVYLAALEQGYTPYTLISDNPLKIHLGAGLGFYQPKNINRKHHGWCSLRIGMEKSRNVMTVRLAQEIGMEPIQEMAQRLGVMDSFSPHLAMALGAGETTLLRLTTAYSMIVNGGKKLVPLFLHKIEDSEGNILYEPADSQGEQILKPETAEAMIDMLKGVVQHGTGQRLQFLTKKYPLLLGGKTGTTNRCFDAWFVGFIKTPQGQTWVVGIFIGYLKPKPMGDHATGTQLALPVFEDFVQGIIGLKAIKPLADKRF